VETLTKAYCASDFVVPATHSNYDWFMSLIYRFRVGLGNWTGAPGVNTFFALAFEEQSASQEAIDAFSDSLKAAYMGLTSSILQGGLEISGPAEVDVLDVATSGIEARMPVTTPWIVNVTKAANAASRATMIKTRFITDRAIRGTPGTSERNRILQGGVYIGPISATAMNSSGAIDGTVRTTVANSFGGLLDVLGMRLAVYSQPKTNKVGVTGYVQSVSTMPLPAVLRSRRD